MRLYFQQTSDFGICKRIFPAVFNRCNASALSCCRFSKSSGQSGTVGRHAGSWLGRAFQSLRSESFVLYADQTGACKRSAFCKLRTGAVWRSSRFYGGPFRRSHQSAFSAAECTGNTRFGKNLSKRCIPAARRCSAGGLSLDCFLYKALLCSIK